MTTSIPTASEITVERMAAERHWNDCRKYLPHLTVSTRPWRFERTEAGPVWSMEVRGPDMEVLLGEFAAGVHGISHLGPVLDFDQPGRVACVWQVGGVWLEVWHLDTVTAPPKPTPPDTPATVPAVAPSRRRLLSRPGGRLPFPRRTKTQKETPAA